MKSLGWFSASIAAGLMLSAEVQAQAHGADAVAVEPSDEHTLTAIKEALVSEAQSVESQVINTAWLDAGGQLHESTMVQSGMKVRGIQVQAYLDEMRKPQVEIALDEKTGLLPECFIKDDHLKRTVQIQPIQMNGQFMVDLESTADAGASRLARQFSHYFDRTPFWQVKPLGPNVDNYTAMMAGVMNEESRFELRVTVGEGFPPEKHRAELVPGTDPISTFLFGAPSKFPEAWIRLSAELIQKKSQDVIWTGVADFRVPVRDVGYESAELPRMLAAGIDQKVEAWSEDLTEYARCEPISFELAEFAGGLQINSGNDAGLRQGDQLLLIDESRIPSRILEPGTLASLSLVEIVDVESDHATLEYRAGAPISDATGKVALPF